METKGLSQIDATTGMAFETQIAVAMAHYEAAMRARDLYIQSLRGRYDAPAEGGWVVEDWSVGFSRQPATEEAVVG